MAFHFPPGSRTPRRRLAFGRGLALCGLLLMPALPTAARTARPGNAATTTTRFACDRGVAFDVAFLRGGVWVTTSGGRWLLRQARSSIGRRYASPDATFILDQDRAALVGLPGGPFLGCVAAGRGRTPQRPGRQA